MAIDPSKLSDFHRNLRRNIQMFLMTATLDQMKREKQISLDGGDTFRAEVIQDCIDEYIAEHK